MLCEECGKNPATLSITVTTGSGTSTRRLCSECVKKMELNLVKGNIQNFLSSVLSVLGSEKKTDTASSAVCTGCGLSFSEFEHTGRLGCAQCYRDFSQQLKPSLQKIHGRVQHTGRYPKNASSDPSYERLRKITELRQRMDEAVASENFEEAASIRDMLKALTEESEVTKQ